MSFLKGWVITVTASWLYASSPEPMASPREDSTVSNVSLQEVLDSVRDASGGKAWDAVKEIDARGITTLGGLTGALSSANSLIDARSFQHLHLGTIERTNGHDGALPWQLDTSGLVDVIDSDRAIAKSITTSFISSNAYLRPLQGEYQASVRLARLASRTFQVVALTPPGGEPLELWVDATTHLIARVVLPMEQQTIEWSDYRRVQGLVLPHRLATLDDAHNEQVTRITTYQLRSDVDAPKFERPASRATDTRLLQPIIMTAAIQGGRVAIRASINGAAPLPFILDTGAGINVLTQDAATRLGISSKGQFNSTDTTVQASVATVSHLQVREAMMTNQRFAIVPWSLASVVIEGQHEPVAGLLGYDFFRRFVVGIDYAEERVSLAPLRACAHENDNTARLYLDESRIPQVGATLNGVTGLWSLDIGNSGASLPGSQRITNDSGTLVAPTLRFTTMALDGQALRSPTSLRFAGEIGYSQLQQLAPVFDYECRTLTLRVATQPASAPQS